MAVASKALICRTASNDRDHGTNGTHSQDQNTRHPRGHWTAGESANVRLFFDRLATKRQVDPLRASSWYPLPRSLLALSGGQAIPNHYSSAYHALFEAYPNLYQQAQAIVRRGIFISFPLSFVFLSTLIISDNIKTTSLRYLLYLCVQNENQHTP